MAIVWLLIGIAGGVLGGMGMGGGTLTIPLLTAVGVEQHAAQAINLIAFLPMSAVALVIHAKNGLVRFSFPVLLMMLAASAAGALGAIAAQSVSAGALRRIFGVFLAILGLIALTKEIVSLVRGRGGARTDPAAPPKLRDARGRRPR